jgi:hypothetical protein
MTPLIHRKKIVFHVLNLTVVEVLVIITQEDEHWILLFENGNWENIV